jgi:hypothetical protein
MDERQNTIIYKNNNWPYIVIIVLLVIIAILAFFVWTSYKWWNLLSWTNSSWNSTTNVATRWWDLWSWNSTTNVATTGSGTAWKDISVKVIWDSRCTECNTSELENQLKTLPFLAWAQFELVDFKDNWVKELMKANNVEKLPAFLFNTNTISDTQFVSFLQKTPSGLYSLNVGSTYDPYGEVCDNKVDDNADWLVDCADPKCSSSLSCAPKVDKPVADLYVMSYCPFWLQAEKWYLEVMDKLGKVADVNIKFVQYIMHGQKEADENVVQYCIQKEQEPKYLKYLKCFLEADGKWEACKKEAAIDEKKLNTCVDATKKEYKVDENMKSWKQYPDFTVEKTEAEKAWVQGSPTFVLNGIKMDKVWRDAKSFADAICSTFKNKPKECEQTFQNITFDPMFGFTSNWSSANAGCNPS